MCRTIKRLALPLAVVTMLWGTPRGKSAADEIAEKKPAVIVVRLPANAELFIGGVKTKQQTAVREFDTPPLSPGKKFSYPLKATWKDGDKEELRETAIIVQAGETKEINLLELKPPQPSIEKIPAPELRKEPEKKPAPKAEIKKTPHLKPEEKKPELKPEPVKKPEEKPKPENRLEPKKKPEPKREPEKNPNAIPKEEKRPQSRPEPITKIDPKPAPRKEPELKAEPKKKPEPVMKSEPAIRTEPKKNPQPQAKPEQKPEPKPAPKGSLDLRMPETLNLQPGGTKLLPIQVVRRDCQGPVSIQFEGLPPGIELKEATLAADKPKAYVLAAAPAEAEEKEWQVKVIGRCGSLRQECPLKIKIAK